MASTYWIKLYHEVLHDPKMGRLPDNLWRRFIELCLVAGEYDQDGELPSLDDIAWTLRMDGEQLASEMDELSNHFLVHFDGDGWVVTNFSKRQAPVSGKERVRRFRERQRKEQYHGNVPETYEIPECNADDTNRYTDTDTDTDTDGDGDKRGADAPPPEPPKQRNPWICVQCGYLLRGLTEPRCPECGTPFDPKLLGGLPLSPRAPAGPS